MFSRESSRLTTLMGSADAPLLYGFGPFSLSFCFSFPFFVSLVSAVLDFDHACDPFACFDCVCELVCDEGLVCGLD